MIAAHSYLLGEFLGTMTLIIFGSGVVASTLLHKSKGQSGAWLAITTGWAIGVLMGVLVALATGSAQADINPVISLTKYLLGLAYPSSITLLLVIAAQCLGAFCGAVFVWLVYYQHFAATKDPDHQLMVFCTQPAIRHLPSNFMTEMLATIVLVIGVGALSVMVNHHALISAGFVPFAVAMLVWGIGLALGGPTGYAINPARDFGPRLAHACLPIANKRDSDWGYALVPILAPIIGAILSVWIWEIIFV